MGHNTWRAKVERIEGIQCWETERELEADAIAVIKKWNADLELRRQDRYGYSERGHYPQFSPHIGAALRANKPILRLLYPACQQVGSVDLRKIVWPVDTPIGSITYALICTFGACLGDSPPPIPLGLCGFCGDPAPAVIDDGRCRG